MMRRWMTYATIMLIPFAVSLNALASDLDSVAEAYADQGKRALDRGDIKAAKKLFKKAIAADTDESHEKLYLARLYNDLGECYRRLSNEPSYQLDPADEEEQNLAGREQLLILAEKYLQQALAIKESVLPVDSIIVARSLENLAHVYYEENKLDESEALYRKALRIRQYKTGAEHIDSASDYLNLGDICSHDSRHSYKDAESNYREALKIWSRSCSSTDPVIGRCYEKLALTYFKNNNFDAAGDYYDRAIAIFAKNGPRCAANLAYLKKELKDLPSDSYASVYTRLADKHKSGKLSPVERNALLTKLMIASRRLGKTEDVKYLQKAIR